jgi:hypothetical protein
MTDIFEEALQSRRLIRAVLINCVVSEIKNKKENLIWLQGEMNITNDYFYMNDLLKEYKKCQSRLENLYEMVLSFEYKPASGGNTGLTDSLTPSNDGLTIGLRI